MSEENKTTEAVPSEVEGEILDPAERMMRFTSLGPVAPGATGQVAIQGPVTLRSVSVDDAETEIVSVMALGRLITRAEGQSWRGALGGVEIKQGSFAIAIARNLAKTTRMLQIVATGSAPEGSNAPMPGSAVAHPVARITQQGMNTGPVDTRRFGRPDRAAVTSRTPPIGVREKGKAIITSKDRGEVVHVGKVAARQAGVRTRESLPQRGSINQAPVTAPMVTAPVLNGPNGELVDQAELDEIEASSTEPRRTVMLLKGHAFALLKYLEHRVPMPEAFISGLRQRLITASTRHVDVGQSQTGTSDVIARMTLDQIQVLESLLRMRVPSAAIGSDIKTSLVTTLKDAFARDKQRSTQVTGPALAPTPSSHEQVSVGATP